MAKKSLAAILVGCTFLSLVMGGCAQQNDVAEVAPSPTEVFSSTPSVQPTNTTAPTVTHTPTATNTPTPTNAPTPTSTPTATPTLTLTPTLTPISEELVDEIMTAYKRMVLIQLNAELLSETAAQVNAGELSGLEEAGAIIVLSQLIQAVEDSLSGYVPPKALDNHWDDVVSVHEQTKDVMRRWVLDEEILSGQVVDEMEPVLSLAANALAGSDQELADEFGFDPALLTEQRQEVLDFVDELFEQ
jgi:hypothetical protein